MSKYNQLWQAIADSGKDQLTITFDQVEQLGGVPLDHSFLQYKKELLAYGYQVDHIFLKKKVIAISKR